MGPTGPGDGKEPTGFAGLESLVSDITGDIPTTPTASPSGEAGATGRQTESSGSGGSAAERDLSSHTVTNTSPKRGSWEIPKPARWILAIAGIAAVLWIFDSSEKTRGRTVTTPTPSSQSTAPPPSAPPVTRSQRAAVAAEIDRWRSAIEVDQSQIQIERTGIELAQAHLASLNRRIEERREMYPDGLPQAEYDEDEAEVDQYNLQLGAVRARIDLFNLRTNNWRRSVEEFNRLVDAYNAGR
jgi:hypothetical protein